MLSPTFEIKVSAADLFLRRSDSVKALHNATGCGYPKAMEKTDAMLDGRSVRLLVTYGQLVGIKNCGLYKSEVVKSVLADDFTRYKV